MSAEEWNRFHTLIVEYKSGQITRTQFTYRWEKLQECRKKL